MRYYPVFLDLRDRPCLVVGQGQLADEKAALLERAGAQVRRADRFNPEQARNSFLIVAVVEDPELGREVKEFGDRNRIFVNVVDQTENCSFIAPAIVDRGNLLIAISTSGKSPALASRIRRELEDQFGYEYSDLLEALAEIRPLVKEHFHSFAERKDFYVHLIQLNLLETLKSEGLETVRTRIQKELKGRDDGR
ncbi:bifunctional precorrin-2 dehydrogenase/sirohydrochlorin ferrochelatase [Acidobacteria bacterium AH-259-A15]|nr:bifunctional precorrin-2 dehydrogenase/sirohydrochlorin ferrochelatase [Acidobacteria bacterium AH-259-A15]